MMLLLMVNSFYENCNGNLVMGFDRGRDMFTPHLCSGGFVDCDTERSDKCRLIMRDADCKDESDYFCFEVCPEYGVFSYAVSIRLPR